MRNERLQRKHRQVENLIRSDSSDILRGDGNANRIDGGLGMDMLRGNGGNDVILGGGDATRSPAARAPTGSPGGSGGDTSFTKHGRQHRRERMAATSSWIFCKARTSSACRRSTPTPRRRAIRRNRRGHERVLQRRRRIAPERLGANTLIEGDVNGDGAADFSILLKGTYSLGSGDFNL